MHTHRMREGTERKRVEGRRKGDRERRKEGRKAGRQERKEGTPEICTGMLAC